MDKYIEGKVEREKERQRVRERENNIERREKRLMDKDI